MDAFNAIMIARAGPRPVQSMRQRLVENIHHQRGLTRTADARDAYKLGKRNCYVNIFQIIGACAVNREMFSIALRRFSGSGTVMRLAR